MLLSSSILAAKDVLGRRREINVQNIIITDQINFMGFR